MSSKTLFLLFVFSCASVGLADAQFKPAATPNPAAPEPPTYSVEVRMARVLVSVKDRDGAPVSDLTRDDFRITDSGVYQNIAAFERNTSLPLSVAILIDTSASTNIELHNEQTSLLRFLPTLLNAGNPNDTFALFSFNWRTTLEVDYARNLGRAEHVLGHLHGEGGTSMYDAICLASETLRGREGRHVMVIVSDGDDTASYRKFEDAQRSLQSTDVVLYPIVVIPIEGDAGRSIGGEHALQLLASSTGGRSFYPDSYARIDEAFAQILRDLRTQYLIGFYPTGVPERKASYHPLNVIVNKPGLQVNARSGYFEP